MPQTPPSGFCNAVILPNRTLSMRPGTSPRAMSRSFSGHPNGSHGCPSSCTADVPCEPVKIKFKKAPQARRGSNPQNGSRGTRGTGGADLDPSELPAGEVCQVRKLSLQCLPCSGELSKVSQLLSARAALFTSSRFRVAKSDPSSALLTHSNKLTR